MGRSRFIASPVAACSNNRALTRASRPAIAILGGGSPPPRTPGGPGPGHGRAPGAEPNIKEKARRPSTQGALALKLPGVLVERGRDGAQLVEHVRQKRLPARTASA